MPSSDDRLRSLLSPLLGEDETAPTSRPLPTTTDDEKTTGTLPSATIPLPGLPGLQTGQQLVPRETKPLPAQQSAAVTHLLTAVRPGVSESTSQRLPVVIKSDLKKRPAPVLPKPLPRRKRAIRRLVVNVIGVVLLALVSVLTLLSVTPLGHEIGLNFDPSQLGSIMGKNQNPTLNGLVAQATATAVFHRQTDGFDPSASNGQTVGNGSGSLNWPVGQCTYWANLRYNRLTGFWVAWNGNADQWLAGAQKAGWHYSQTPHVPSIIVLMAGVQGASAYGHVAVVESLVNSTTVHTSNMNWYANGGGFDKVSYVDFTTGPGVWFVWHP